MVSHTAFGRKVLIDGEKEEKMDIFIEEMVERKRTAKDVAIVFGLMVLSVIFAYLLLVEVFSLIPQLGSVLFLLTAGVIYIAYRFSMSLNVEYEYLLVKNEIDIDKIMNRKKRKRLTTVNLKGLEAFGRCGGNREYERLSGDISVKKIYACKKKNDENNYFVVYFENSMRVMTVFSPSEKIVEVIEKLNPKRA